MKIVCSYCQKDLGEKPPFDSELISHGMCDTCYETYAERWLGQPLEQYLDNFEAPVIVVNEDVRVVAANEQMKKILDKSERDYFGQLAGEVMECRFSRMPGGCGKTVHCAACTIRKTVTKLLDSDEPSHDVPAYLNRDNDRLELRISAEKVDDVVKLTVTEMKPAEFINDKDLLLEK